MKYEQIIQNVKNERIDIAIAAAAQLYLDVGIADTKMTDIAEEAQLGVASLYRYFGTKQLFTVKVGSYIWKQKLRELENIYAGKDYEKKTGIEQVEALMNVFPILLEDHASFLRFLSEFDAFVVRERLTAGDLAEYEQSVLGVMPLMENAVAKGIADGTIRSGINAQLFYLTACHSLLSMCQKFARGKILHSDNPQVNKQELDTAIEMFVSYIRA